MTVPAYYGVLAKLIGRTLRKCFFVEELLIEMTVRLTSSLKIEMIWRRSPGALIFMSEGSFDVGRGEDCSGSDLYVLFLAHLLAVRADLVYPMILI